MAEETERNRLERWLSVVSSVVAPVTLLTALLFYFGYVSARAQYRYFGLDVDAVGLSTQAYVMRSPQALLVPLLSVTLGGGMLVGIHVLLVRRPPQVHAVRWIFAAAGTALLGGLVLLFGYQWVGSWALYALVTPILIAGGTGAGTYSLHRWRPRRPQTADDAATPRWVRPSTLVLAVVVVATCLFWATATVAEWTGLGNAMRTARNLDELPSVILDTKDRLFLTDGIVEETTLPAYEGQTFRYRYRRLRLLIQGEDRMFLVPERWSPNNSTIAVPLDGSVRVRFRFVNRQP